MHHSTRMTCLLVLLFGLLGVCGKRVASRQGFTQEYGPPDPASAPPIPASYVSLSRRTQLRLVPPFDISFKLTNKEQVVPEESLHESSESKGWAAGKAPDWALNKQAIQTNFATDKLVDQVIDGLPAKMSEFGIPVTVEKEEIDGLTVKLLVKIGEYGGYDHVVDALAKYRQLLVDLNMGQKYDDDKMEQRTVKAMKAALIRKIRNTLEKEFVEDLKVTCEIMPDESVSDSETILELPERLPEPSSKHYYRLTVTNRQTIVGKAKNRLPRLHKVPPSKLLDADGPTFLAVVRELLEIDVPLYFMRKYQGSVDVAIATDEDLDASDHAEAGDTSKKQSFGLSIEVQGVEVESFIKARKGADYVQKFHELLKQLKIMEENGVQGMDILQENFKTDVKASVSKILEVEMPPRMEEAVGAEVVVLNEAVYNQLRESAAVGRCCGVDSSCSVNVGLFFVEGEHVLEGGGLLGTGLFGKKGKCPTINTKDKCQKSRATQTHFCPLMSCFQVDKSSEPMKLRMIADSVTAKCASDD